jgi:hypothetical protein
MPFVIQGKTNWKYILIVVLLAAIVGGGILWLAVRREIPFIELPKKNPVIDAKHWTASSLLKGPRMTEFHTLVYEDGKVVATKVLDGKVVDRKECEPISKNMVEDAINDFYSLSQGFSNKPGFTGIPGSDYEIIINTPSTSRKIVQSSNFSRIVEFSEYYNRIVSWCSLEPVEKEGKISEEYPQAEKVTPEKIKEWAEGMITITTDKSEYEQEEMIKINIKNSGKLLFYLDKTPYFYVEKLENSEWMPIEEYIGCPCGAQDCVPKITEPLLIYDNAMVIFIWDQLTRKGCKEGETIWSKAPPGKYRVVCDFLIKHLATGIETREKNYSNEFIINKKERITEKVFENWKTYTNEKFKFSLKYPSDWKYIEGKQTIPDREHYFIVAFGKTVPAQDYPFIIIQRSSEKDVVGEMLKEGSLILDIQTWGPGMPEEYLISQRMLSTFRFLE